MYKNIIKNKLIVYYNFNLIFAQFIPINIKNIPVYPFKTI